MEENDIGWERLQYDAKYDNNGDNKEGGYKD